MKKTNKALIIAGVFIAGVSVASASVIGPGLISDFEDGTSDGWTAGPASKKAGLLPRVGTEGYLQVQAFADDNGTRSGANRRIVFYNKSDKWTGDYTNISAVKGDFKATSDEESALYMRLNFKGEDHKVYSSKSVFELATDGAWKTFSFALDASNFVTGVYNLDDREYGDDPRGFQSVSESQFSNALLHVHELKFVSSKDDSIWAGVDIVRAKLGVDNLAAVSAVPLPGAVWMMITGLVGLSGFTAKRRSKA